MEVSTVTRCGRHRRGATTRSSSGYSPGGATSTRCRRHRCMATARSSSDCSPVGPTPTLKEATTATRRRWHRRRPQLGGRAVACWGADVNAHGGYHGSALKAASAKGYNQIAERLLDVGGQLGHSDDSFRVTEACCARRPT
jgi:hypothetical protein